jgi:hypothetical protein
MSADNTPATPEAATARLTELTADKEWGLKVTAGDPAAVAEFHSLTELSVREPAQTAEQIAEASQRAADDRNLKSFLDGARAQFPVSDDVAKQIAEDQPVSEPEKQLGIQWLQQLTNDRELTAKLMNGDIKTRQQFFNASVLASSAVKDGAPGSAVSLTDLLNIGQNQSRDLRKEI